jgi:predicted dehydrogenase
MKDKVRVGILGSKFAADFHAACYKRDPRVELVAVSAIDNLEPYAKRWDIPHTHASYHDLLKRDDIDLVSVCLPNYLHYEAVLAAGRAGKHVVCEKPLATEMTHAEEMLACCVENNIKLFYAEDWCFAPALIRACEIIRQGAIGDVLFVKAKEVHNGTHSPFAKNKATCGGGCLIHLAIHPIGWVLHALGGPDNPVVEVTGKVNGGGADNYVHKDNSGEDWSLGVMKFKNGIHAFVEGNYITVGGMDDKVEIYGSQGLVKADLTFGSPLRIYSRKGYDYAVEKADNTLGWTQPAVDEFANLGYVSELRYFVDCVVKNEQPMFGVDGRAGLACLQIVHAMYESAAQGKAMYGSW